jgi:hypothetical protein
MRSLTLSAILFNVLVQCFGQTFNNRITFGQNTIDEGFSCFEINDKYQKKAERDPTQFLEANPNYVKYVSVPMPGSESNLEDKKIIVKNLDYGYRITMGRTRQNYNNFLQWCTGKDKVKLTKRASSQLAKEHSWGGYYFYVKDDKSLTMVKMFLSSNIQNVERCVKQ